MYLINNLILLMINTLVWAAPVKENPVAHLPESFQSYQITDRLDYTGETLFNYINGGAELYLSYGFIGMKGYKYNADGLPQVTAEVYEMTEAKNAFGVFTHSRDEEEYDYGQGSQSFNDAILFWKDRYFVVVNTHQVTPESQEAIRHFASLLDAAIPEKGETPSLIHSLPENGLVPGGYIYFHHYVWLNSYYFIADYNIIGIEKHTDAVLAKYGPAEARSYLLIVEYPDMETARDNWGILGRKFAPENAPGATAQMEDNTWFKTWYKDNKLGAIFNSPSDEETEKLFKETFDNM